MTAIKKMARGLVALAVSAGGLGFAGTAEAGHGGNVHCGQTIAANTTTTLTGNVAKPDGTPCTDDGVIMAIGATLDLHGFQILGATANSTATPTNPNVDDAGILFPAGVTGATVTDSTATSAGGTCASTNAVSGFDAGIAIIGGASGNTVEKVNVVGNVGLDGDYGEGIHVRDADSNTIFCNNVSANGPYGGATLLDDSDGNTLDSNNVAGNEATHQDIAIRLEVSTLATAQCPDTNTVSNSTIGPNALDGISILNGANCDSIGNILSTNTISGHARDGIRLNARSFSGDCRGANGTHVHNNVITGNGGSGIKATSCVEGSHIHGNNVVGNNPEVAGTPGNPLLPPHGDLHDNNVNCTPPGIGAAANVWTGNLHGTEFAAAGSATVSGNPLDYVCIS